VTTCDDNVRAELLDDGGHGLLATRAARVLEVADVRDVRLRQAVARGVHPLAAAVAARHVARLLDVHLAADGARVALLQLRGAATTHEHAPVLLAERAPRRRRLLLRPAGASVGGGDGERRAVAAVALHAACAHGVAPQRGQRDGVVGAAVL
jgi:hypothetical protein